MMHCAFGHRIRATVSRAFIAMAICCALLVLSGRPLQAQDLLPGPPDTPRNTVFGTLGPILIRPASANVEEDTAILAASYNQSQAPSLPPPVGSVPGSLPASGWPPSVQTTPSGSSNAQAGPPDNSLLPEGPAPAPSMPYISPDAFKPIFRLHQSISNDVGEDEVTSLGGFQPRLMDGGIWYLDGQFGVLEGIDNPGQQTLNFEANLGIGFRWYLPADDTILGLSFWYDCDRSRPNFVHQASVGGEWLGPVWQARANGYFPIGLNGQQESFSALGTPFFQGENILFPRTQFDSISMAGTDVEIGRKLPGWLGEHGLSAYTGLYYYRGDSQTHTFGISARFEALVSKDLTIDVRATNDPLFNSEVGIGITWLLPIGRCKTSCCKSCGGGEGGGCGCGDSCCDPPDLYYRLVEMPQRSRTVVFATSSFSNPAVATDPTTGQAIRVVHVDSNAAPGGNGSVADPYQTLPTAQAGSQPGDIVFANAVSTFNAKSLVLKANQRLLGEGIDHTVNTAQAGTILLPRATSNSALPIVQNSPGDAITLANDTEVSGLQIKNPVGAAIAGNGVTGTVSINNNQINGGAVGLNLQNSSANFNVTATPISGAATGIQLQNNSGTSTFSGTTMVSGSTATGIAITGQSGAASFNNLAVTATTGTGLSDTNSTGTLTIGGGSITASAGTAVNISSTPLAVTLHDVSSTGGATGISLNQATGNFTVTGDGTTAGSGGTIASSTGDGVAITGSSGVSLSNMNVNSAGTNAVEIMQSSGVTINGFHILNPVGEGIKITSATGTIGVNGNQVTGGTAGLDVQTSSATFNLAGNTFTNSATGIQLLNDTGPFNFTGTTTVSGSTVNGLLMTGLSGNVSFGQLSISATSGAGLLMSGSPVTLTITGGTITDASGTALSITGSTLAVVLQSVSASGGANGILLSQVSGSLEIDGGTISNTSGAGVSIGNSSGITLNGLTITGAAGDGVDVSASNNITLHGLSISQSGTTANGITLSNDGTGITVTSNTVTAIPGSALGIAVETSAGGSYLLANNTITGSGANSVGLVVEDLANSPITNSYQIDGNTITLSGANSTGIDLIRIFGTSTLSGTVSNVVTAPTPFASVGGGNFTGHIIVNGVSEP